MASNQTHVAQMGSQYPAQFPNQSGSMNSGMLPMMMFPMMPSQYSYSPQHQFPHTSTQPSPRTAGEKKSRALKIIDPDTNEEITPTKKVVSASATAQPSPSVVRRGPLPILDASKSQPANSNAGQKGDNFVSTTGPADSNAGQKGDNSVSTTGPANSNAGQKGDSSVSNTGEGTQKADVVPAATVTQTFEISSQTTQVNAEETVTTITQEADTAIVNQVSPACYGEDSNEEDDDDDDDDVEDDDEEDDDVFQDETPDYPAEICRPDFKSQNKAYPLDFLMNFERVCYVPLESDSQIMKVDLKRDGKKFIVANQRVPRSSRSVRRSSSSSRRGGGVGSLPFVAKMGKRQKNITIPTAPQEKLERGQNAWAAAEKSDVDEHLAKAQGILNKLTVEKFDKLSAELLLQGIQLPEDLLGQFIDKIFQKAIDEPFFSELYARLCNYLCRAPKLDDPEIAALPSFRRLLLTSCQQEFQKDRSNEKDQLTVLERRKRDATDGALPTTPQQIEEEEDRLLKARRHMFGNIKFIGELFKLGMVQESIMHRDCIQPLLKSTFDEEGLACLCKLLETAGEKLDRVPKKDEKVNPKALMDSYFLQLKQLAQDKQLPARVRFMMLDVIEMRNRSWIARKKAAGPKKISEIHQQASAEQQKLTQQDNLARMEHKGKPGKARGPLELPSDWLMKASAGDLADVYF